MSPPNTSEFIIPRQTLDTETRVTTEPVNFPKLLLVAIVLCLATVCVAVDNTILSTAVPQITDSFDSIDDVGWYAAIYPLTSCAFQPFFGKVYSLFSNKVVFLASLLVFEVGSAICATAPTSNIFILGRALAGLGSAGIGAGTTLILAECVPLPRRPTWNSIIGSTFALGSVAGPLLGGAFTENTTWRWCFYINLPIGGVVMLFVTLFYKSTSSSTRAPTGLYSQLARFDVGGTITMMLATICLLLALSWGGTKYAWDDTHIIVLLTASGILFCAFAGIERWMQDSALIPLRLLRRRSMGAAILFSLCLGGVFFVNVYYIPVESAITFIPFMCSVVGGFVCAGLGTAATGYYTPFVYGGSILMAVGTGLLATVRPHQTPRARWIGYQILCGAGIGLGEEQGLYMVQTTLPEADVATGLGIVLFAQTFGGAVFVSVAQAVFLELVTAALRTLAPDVDPYAVLGGAATVTSPALQSAYAAAIKDALRVGLVLAAVSSLGALLYDWHSLKGKREEGIDGRGGGHELIM